jgi:GTP1/Obg family GTP-binding protein
MAEELKRKVAREIFEEIEKRLDDITIVMGRLDSLRTFHKTMEKITAEVAELKKKYTEEGK